MSAILDVSSQAFFGQLLLGLMNGAFYALMSLGLAIIFGMLNIINFAHGAQYMLGAFGAYFLLRYLGVGYWWALVILPLAVGALGIVTERLLLQRLYRLEHIYGLLFTFGVALVIQGVFRNYYGSSGMAYQAPAALRGATDLGFMLLPNYRGWVVVLSLIVCLLTWLAIEKTQLGSYLRAATENPKLVRAFGINVPRMITMTYGFGVALAALAGVMAAPLYNVSPQMGSELIIVTFAIVVIGGMGSILGAIVAGFGLGVIEGLTKLFLPAASEMIIFVVMALVLLILPAGLFGQGGGQPAGDAMRESVPRSNNTARDVSLFLVMVALLVVAPAFVYPVLLMKVLCFALFVCGFNQLLGFTGLLSFGHAMFFGWGGYIAAIAAKSWNLPPETCLVVGGLVAAGLGAVVGSLAIRRQGIYFAMITLAFAQMFYFVAVQAPFTGGEDGIQAVPRGHLFGVFDLSRTTAMYAFVVGVFLIGFLFVYRIIHSPFGEVLVAIRENEQRAISLGYNTKYYKLLAFILSSAITGVAGSLKALAFEAASLADVHWSTSGEVVLMALVGGVGTLFGPVIGAAMIIGLQHYLGGIGQWITVVEGLVFIACVLAFRRGIAGEADRLTATLRKALRYIGLRSGKAGEQLVVAKDVAGDEA